MVPVVNENDAIADDEIRFGDNDRLAALVAHLVGADILVLLTDTPGLLTADPRLDAEASLIEEIVEVDHELEAMAGGAGTERGSGGMASKLAAAKIAAWSGVRAVIAAAERPGVLADAVAGAPGVGTVVRAPPPPPAGPQAVDRLRRGLGGHHPGRRRGPAGAVERGGRCCPPGWSGSTGVRGRRRGGGGRPGRAGLRQGPGPAIRVAGPEWAGQRTADLPARRARRGRSTATTW